MAAPVSSSSLSDGTLSQWSNGGYLNADNSEDDFMVMENHGLVLESDDHGNTLNTASGLVTAPINVQNNTVEVLGFGLIEDRYDTDLFSFHAGKGKLSIAVGHPQDFAGNRNVLEEIGFRPLSSPRNLSLKVNLLNQAGQVIASTTNTLLELEIDLNTRIDAQNTEGLDTFLSRAHLNFNIQTEGQYYIQVEGVGRGDPDSGGYTDYGSVGNYAVAGTVASYTECNAAFDNDGSGAVDIVNIPLHDDFTIEGWVRLDRDANINTTMGVLGSGNQELVIHNGYLRLEDNGRTRILSQHQLRSGEWSHYALVRQQGILRLYTNGQLDTQTASIWNGVFNISQLGASTTGKLGGQIDEWRVWDIARNDTDIAERYFASVDSEATGLLAYYKFNQTDSIIDETGNGFSGTVSRGISFVFPGGPFVDACGISTFPEEPVNQAPTIEISVPSLQFRTSGFSNFTDPSAYSTAFNETFQLKALVSDDGFPLASALSVTWSSSSDFLSIENPTALNTTATFEFASASEGFRNIATIQATVTDGELSSTTRIRVNPIGGDTFVTTAMLVAPSVAELSIELGSNGVASIDLSGFISPFASTISRPPLDFSFINFSWSVVNGASNAVSFSTPNGRATTAHFQQPGVYTIGWTAQQDGFSQTETATITVTSNTPNSPPTVDAGDNRRAIVGQAVPLIAQVSDDGYPNPPGATRITWMQKSGPGTASIANTAVASTTVTFPQSGSYVLTATVSDGILESIDEVEFEVTVLPPNDAPVVNAGADQSIFENNPTTLVGTATDDGNPSPANLITAWRKVSGPGAVVFGSPNALTTSAMFNQGGVYVVALTANDGALTTEDQVIVNVAHDRFVSFDGNDFIGLGNQTLIKTYPHATIEFMVRGAANTSGVIYSESWTSSGYRGQFRMQGNGRGKLNVRYNPDKRLILNTTSNKTVFDGRWHHVALVKTGYYGTLYIDGEVDRTGLRLSSRHAKRQNTSTLGGVMVCCNQNLQAFPTSSFTGDLNEVRFWGASLSTADIVRRKDRHLIGNEPFLLGYLSFEDSANGFVTVSNNGLTTKVSGITQSPLPNNPPSVEKIADQTNRLGDSVSLQVSAIDVDGDTLAYSENGLPDGLSLSASSGLISGVIGNNNSVSSEVTITVTDGTVSSTQTFTWNLIGLPPTVVNPGNQVTLNGSAIALIIEADAIENLSFAATGLPNGLVIDATTGEISGTPTLNGAVAETSNVVVTITDTNGLATEIQFDWTVNPVIPIVNNALFSNGASAVELTNPITLTGDFTIEAWVNLTPGLEINHNDGLVSDSQLNGARQDINIYQERIRLFSHDAPGRPRDLITATQPTIAGVWTHYAFVREAGDMRIYINGALNIAENTNWNGNFVIRRLASALAGHLAGQMDELRIWQVARTASEISTNYTMAIDPGANGLAAYYKFNECCTAKDELSLHGGVLGAGQSVDTPSTAPITELNQNLQTASSALNAAGQRAMAMEQVTLDGDFTIESWVHLAYGQPVDDTDGLVASTNQDINFDQGRIRLFSQHDRIVANYVAQPGRWDHYAFVRKNGQLSLYINGQLNVSNPAKWTEPLTVSTLASSRNGSLSGRIDNLRIWGAARSAAEIAASQDIDALPVGDELITDYSFEYPGAILNAVSGTSSLLGTDFTQVPR